jgi:transcriptional regulator with XRE-family HTH domain
MLSRIGVRQPQGGFMKAVSGKSRRGGRTTPVLRNVHNDTGTIGIEIRDLRKARSLTLQKLADATGLSVGHLSEIERGQAEPSVKALNDIARALGVTIGWFFHPSVEAPREEREYVVRATNRRKLNYESGITDELLCPNLSGALELLLCRFAPRSSSGEAPYSHNGEEAGIVIRGSLELWIDGRKFLLREGDSFRFASALRHRYRNPDDDETIVVWAITPPSF